MVATPVPVGISPHWMDRKGTSRSRRKRSWRLCSTFARASKHTASRISWCSTGMEETLLLYRRRYRSLRGNWASVWRRIPTGTHTRRRSSRSIWSAERLPATLPNSRHPLQWPPFRSGFIGRALTTKRSSRTCILRTHNRRNIQEEEFAREARLASTAKGEAMIDIAVKWTAGRLRQH